MSSFNFLGCCFNRDKLEEQKMREPYFRPEDSDLYDESSRSRLAKLELQKKKNKKRTRKEKTSKREGSRGWERAD